MRVNEDCDEQQHLSILGAQCRGWPGALAECPLLNKGHAPLSSDRALGVLTELFS